MGGQAPDALMARKKGPRARKLRYKLYCAQQGLCHWCRKPMQWVDTEFWSLRSIPPDMCTLDHLDPRWHPQRGTRASGRRIVAACWACNNERDKQLHRQIPRELLHRAAMGNKAITVAKEHAEQLLPLFTGAAPHG